MLTGLLAGLFGVGGKAGEGECGGHGEGGKGNREFGAPNLTDAIFCIDAAFRSVIQS